ncbi:EamA family transporter [Phaeovulum sp. W22_SRMD_FR3]|uniref:EamA family transporter n=1 Tax=Phaeovulum sp. W22_SRMD_FR3 TaxID=3240274 RepID=UPI003F9BC192
MLATWPAGFAEITPSQWLSLGYVSVFSMLVGFVFWYRGLARGGIAGVGQLQLLQPFFGLALAALLLGEPVAWSMIAVTVFVVLCVAGAKRFASGGELPARRRNTLLPRTRRGQQSRGHSHAASSRDPRPQALAGAEQVSCSQSEEFYARSMEARQLGRKMGGPRRRTSALNPSPPGKILLISADDSDRTVSLSQSDYG